MNLNQRSELAKSTKKWFITVINHLHQSQYQKCQQNWGPPLLITIFCRHSMPSSRLLPGPSIQSLPIQVCQFEEKQFQSFVDSVPLIIQDKDNIFHLLQIVWQPPSNSNSSSPQQRSTCVCRSPRPTSEGKGTSNYLRESKIHNSWIRSTYISSSNVLLIFWSYLSLMANWSVPKIDWCLRPLNTIYPRDRKAKNHFFSWCVNIFYIFCKETFVQFWMSLGLFRTYYIMHCPKISNMWK